MVAWWIRLCAVPVAGLLAAACGGGGDSGDGGQAGSAKRIAFFGFAKANSFTAATFAGVQEYARAHDAEAEFLDPNFDAQVQVRQIQDAVTSKRFQVFIVQANDGAAVVPAIRSALRAGIKVVVQFTPVGTKYDIAAPQVDGTITLIDVPTENGRRLGTLAGQACKDKKLNPCKVAYLEGLRALPLDNARTQAAVDLLKSTPGVQVAAQLEGGYTKESGRKAMQDLLQRRPDVNVVIGSSQALFGAEAVAKGKKILYIANGASRQAVKAVQDGRWFAAAYLPVKTMGAKAAELGLTAARGGQVPRSNIMKEFAPGKGLGTKATLAGVTGEYDE